MANNTQKAKYAGILIKPRITEKANMLAEANVHAFEIASCTSKPDVQKAVKAFYGVNVVKIAITKNPSKKVFVRGKKGVKSGIKKAYVYLKRGDKLE